MFFEVMGATEEFTRQAMAEHVSKMRKLENMKVISESLSEVPKVEDPPKQFKGREAYSQIADVEVVVSSLENLVYSVIFFGPSSIEIIEPKSFTVNLNAAQSMANAVAEIMHRYAAGGAGGIVISTKK